MENSSDRLEFFLSFMENSSERLVISIPEISLHCPAPWASGRWALGKHKFLEISDCRWPLAVPRKPSTAGSVLRFCTIKPVGFGTVHIEAYRTEKTENVLWYRVSAQIPNLYRHCSQLSLKPWALCCSCVDWLLQEGGKHHRSLMHGQISS